MNSPAHAARHFLLPHGLPGAGLADDAYHAGWKLLQHLPIVG